MTTLHRILLTPTLTLLLGTALGRAQTLEAISIHSLANPETTSAPSGTQFASTEKPEQSKALRRAYQWSLAAISAGTAADIASSLKFSSDGQHEANTILRGGSGGYGAKGATIEAGVLGASLVMQHYLVKRHPGLRVPFAITNFALAGFQVWNVHHNVSY
jgi:hypothetical protein